MDWIAFDATHREVINYLLVILDPKYDLSLLLQKCLYQMHN